MAIEIIKPPYLTPVLDVLGADAVQSVIVDLGSLPIRASVQLNTSDTTDYVVSVGNDPDNLFVSVSNTFSTTVVIDYPLVAFRYLGISMTPDSTADIQAIVHTKF